MIRKLMVPAMACALLSGWTSDWASGWLSDWVSGGIEQDRQSRLPEGPAPGPADQSWLASMLMVQANMTEGGEVMFLVPIADEDPNKNPSPPALLAKVDGKSIKAFGADRKPLDIVELERRLSSRTAAVVVHGQPPDPFFLKALHERTVVFVVPKRMFDQMAKAASESSIQGWWTVMKKAGAKEEPTAEVWSIEPTKIGLRHGNKIEGYLNYRIDAESEPHSLDLIPDRGSAQGQTLKGIYELDGLTLKICFVSPENKEPKKARRPRTFGEPGTVTMTFRRILP